MDDGSTVPLFYQKRVPEMQNQNEDLSREFYELLEDENLDDAQQAKLEKKFARETEVIKRDDRLEKVAADIAYHFPRRGYLGKGIVVSLDKFTAVRMFDKVQRHWKEEIKRLRGVINSSANEREKSRLRKRLDYMRSVEMAIVISEESGDSEKFQAQGLDIKPHRDRLNRLDENGHDIEYNFKDETNPLQLVFVCAMWLTGFDAPTVSTLYLDKPMRDHTLMQTIARANRVTSYKINDITKTSGEIIDYYNVFRNMKEALKDYAQGQDESDAPPVREKSELFRLLDESIEQGFAFCREKNFDLETILDDNETFKNIHRFKEFADILLGADDWRRAFNVYENTISSLYEADKPEILGAPVARSVAVFQYLRGVIDGIIEQRDVDLIGIRIGELLDESVVAAGDERFKSNGQPEQFQIIARGRVWDLSKIDFEKLKKDFPNTKYKNIEIADLRAFLEKKLEQMLAENVTRSDFARRLQEIIDRYNADGSANENYYQELVEFAERLKSEDERSLRESLSADELELFDLLKKDSMTKDEEQKVKLAAKFLLRRLRDEQPKVLVQDWFKDSHSRKVVHKTVEDVLDKQLPATYNRKLFNEKCTIVFDTMIDYASRNIRWAA